MAKPNPEIVAVTWIKHVTGLANSVNTTLPKDNTTWAASGFIQVVVVGGSPNIDVPMRQPIYQIDCWATNPSSNKPPWGKASSLAEMILDNCYERRDKVSSLALPSPYTPVRIHSVYASIEPRRIHNDPASFARIQLELTMHWVAL